MLPFWSVLIISLFAWSAIQAETVLITGANRGLGLEFARQFKEKGWKVIGTARKPAEAKELNALGIRIEELDVAKVDSIEKLVQRLEKAPLDVVINNAGVLIGRHDQLEEETQEDMQYSFKVNATGPLLVTQALLPNLRRGKRKHIVNISSQLGSITNNSGGMYAYRASKAALNQITKSLSIDLKPEGFVCIALHPGWVATDMGGENATYSPSQAVASMIQVITKLNPQVNGQYLDLHGKELPW